MQNGDRNQKLLAGEGEPVERPIGRKKMGLGFPEMETLVSKNAYL